MALFERFTHRKLRADLDKAMGTIVALEDRLMTLEDKHLRLHGRVVKREARELLGEAPPGQHAYERVAGRIVRRA